MIEIFVNKLNTKMVTNKIVDKHVEILQRIGMFFNLPVEINYMNSDVIGHCTGNNGIIVNMWSAPSSSNEMLLPDVDKAFDKTYCTDGVFAPSEGYLTFGDDIPLIQYKDNNFYFLYDVCEYQSQDEIELMQMLLNGILVQIEGTQELVDAKIEYYAVLELEKQTKAFIEGILRKERDQKGERERQLNESTRRMEDYRREIRNLVLNIKIQQDILLRNGDSINELKDMLHKELEVMRTNKKVKRVNITTSGELEIFTNTIFATVIGRDKVTRKYRFGDYKITVNATNGKVRYYNMNQKDTHKSCWSANDQHPHVSNSGSPCLGSASTLIMDCVDRYQWGVLIDVLINYLESVNIDDSAGKNYWRWEQVDNEGKKLATQYRPSNGTDD